MDYFYEDYSEGVVEMMMGLQTSSLVHKIEGAISNSWDLYLQKKFNIKNRVENRKSLMQDAITANLLNKFSAVLEKKKT